MGEAGATPVQEIAFTLADGIAYVQAAIDAGLDVDTFAPRLSFFFVARSTLLEEVAKFRAARRLWASIMRDRFGAQETRRAQMLRFHTQTAGVQLTAQQPEVNMVRVAIQALAATLGGTQSLHTNSYDEALALPTEKSARLALRTQQVIAHESDVGASVDPLAGLVHDRVDDRRDRGAGARLHRAHRRHGRRGARDRGGVPEDRDRARRVRAGQEHRQRRADRRRRQRVQDGRGGPAGAAAHRRIDPAGTRSTRSTRSSASATRRRSTSASPRSRRRRPADDNLLPPMREALRRRATLQEVCDVLRDEFGGYIPTDRF
jgi:methylmalonyl-CoA mutase, N-terminal domain